MAMSEKDKNAVLTALGHPIRRAVLRKIDTSNGGVSPSELAKELDAPLALVSYHVRILAKSGVLKLTGVKTRRGAVEHYYKRAGNAVDQKATEMLSVIGNGKD